MDQEATDELAGCERPTISTDPVEFNKILRFFPSFP